MKFLETLTEKFNSLRIDFRRTDAGIQTWNIALPDKREIAVEIKDHKIGFSLFAADCHYLDGFCGPCQEYCDNFDLLNDRLLELLEG